MTKTQSTLEVFRKANYAGAPWLARVEPNTAVVLLLNLATIEAITSQTPWGEQLEADAHMKGPGKGGDIIDEDGDHQADEGTHRIPFWACNGLQMAIKEYEDDGGDMDGWMEVAYQRQTERGRNKAGNKVDINEGIWALSQD